MQVERAYRTWLIGTSNNTLMKFSQDFYGRRSRFYLRSVNDLRESTWTSIVEAAAHSCDLDYRTLAGDLDSGNEDDVQHLSDQERDCAVIESESDDGKSHQSAVQITSLTISRLQILLSNLPCTLHCD